MPDSPSPGQAVVILSTMRSGSTLLKALLAAAEDVSNLPEIDFQKLKSMEEVAQLAQEPIKVLKRPAWFNETGRYPALPPFPAKRIILARDVAATVLSLRKMAFRQAEGWLPENAVNRWLGTRYWAQVYDRLFERFPADDPSNFWIRYEDLIAQPRQRTAELFAFIGSRQRHGVDEYPPPGDYEWKWGSDDGGPKIRGLKALPPRPPRERELNAMKQLHPLPSIAAARRKLGYA